MITTIVGMAMSVKGNNLDDKDGGEEAAFDAVEEGDDVGEWVKNGVGENVDGDVDAEGNENGEDPVVGEADNVDVGVGKGLLRAFWLRLVIN